MKDGLEEKIDPLVSITPHKDGIQVTNDSYSYPYKLCDIVKISIEEIQENKL